MPLRLFFALVLLIWPGYAQADDDVSCVQAFLADTAFDPGPVDGQWGRRTATALEDFFAQAGQEVGGGLDQSNAAEICRVLSADADGRLKAIGQFRRYAISIDEGLLANIDPTYFDFSAYEIATGTDYRCRFTFFRIEPALNNETISRAQGSVDIVDGTLNFGTHFWSTGGLDGPEFLQEQSNLKLTASGMVVGRTPYFWRGIQPGEVAIEPSDAVLSDEYLPNQNAGFPLGRSLFDVPNEPFRGALELSSCRAVEADAQPAPARVAAVGQVLPLIVGQSEIVGGNNDNALNINGKAGDTDLNFILIGHFDNAGRTNWLTILFADDLTRDEAEALTACRAVRTQTWNDGSIHAELPFFRLPAGVWGANDPACLREALPPRIEEEFSYLLSHFQDIAIALDADGYGGAEHEGLTTFLRLAAAGDISIACP